MHHQTRLQIHDLLVRLSVLVFISVLLSSCVPSDPEASSYISTTATCTSDESQMVTEVVNGYCYAREVKVKIADAEGDIYIHDVSGAGGKIAVVASVFSGDGSSQDVFLLIYDTQGNQIGKQKILSQVDNTGSLNICDNGTDTILFRNDGENVEIFRLHPEDASIEALSQLDLPETVMADPRVQLLPNGMIVLNGFSIDESPESSLLFYKTDGTFLGLYSDMLLSGGVIYWKGQIYAPMTSYSGAMSRPVPIDMTDWTAGEPVDTIQFWDSLSLLYYGNSLYEVTGQGIFMYDESNPEGKQVVDKSNTDLDQVVYDFSDDFSVVSEERFTCYTQSSPYDKFAIMTCSDTHPKDGKTELVIGGFMNPNAALMHAIHLYNITNDDFYLSVVDYGDMNDANGEPYVSGEGGYEKLYPQLMKAIIDGSGPDLMFFGNSGHESADCCHFEKAGFFLDLMPYLQGGSEVFIDTVLPNILTASMSGDKLYKIPYATRLEIFYPHVNVLLSSIDTVEEFEQVMKEFPEGSIALHNLKQSELLSQMFAYNYDVIIYEANGSFKFDTKLFKDILEFSKKFGWNKQLTATSNEADRNFWQYYENGMIALDKQWISSPFEFAYYQSENAANGFGQTPIPLPCRSESVGCIISEEMIAVTSTTLHPEGAAEFIQFLLGKEIQSYVWGFNEDMPVRKEIFDYIIGDLPYPEDFAEYSKATDKDDYEMWGFVTDNCTQEEIIEDGRLFKPIFLGSNFLYYPDRDMEKIIIEEAAAFFEGQKSAEEVAKIVENRLLLIVAERGGI